jgi:acetyl-CoA/propionyl-CoA carboxylase biotin carboxyl carrier protein
MDDADFTEQFAVHTRWIETDFAGRIEFAPRQTPKQDEALTRTWIEFDGRRVQLGLPANLLRGAALSEPGRVTQASPESINETSVEAPISGVLHSWLVDNGKTVQEGEVIAVMEAMKMEVQVMAHRSGTLKQQAETGHAIEAGSPLGEIA